MRFNTTLHRGPQSSRQQLYQQSVFGHSGILVLVGNWDSVKQVSSHCRK